MLNNYVKEKTKHNSPWYLEGLSSSNSPVFSMPPTGYKLAKYDRGPDPDVDDRGVKITSKGKIKWSQTMLGNLQLSRQRALKKVAGKKDALGPMWKEEWTKMYPDLKV